jgi:hypothetical protein
MAAKAAIFMSRHVAFILLMFQWLSMTWKSSTRHTGDMRAVWIADCLD